MMSRALSVALFCATVVQSAVVATPKRAETGLSVSISVAEGILSSSTAGHIQVFFAPPGVDPLDDTDVTSSPNYFYGQNVFDYGVGSTAVLSGGDDFNTDVGVYGWPNVSLNEVPEGDYSVQAFLNIYETVTRADGSTVSLRFPCGDGGAPVGGYGSPMTSIVNVTVTGETQMVELEFNDVVPAEEFTGSEIGGCSQGNYKDTDFIKYVKIRSDVLSDWWGRDMYVGANVLLPFGYDEEDDTRYPVMWSQGHWPADTAPLNYNTVDAFRYAWNNGTIPETNKTTPKIIMINIRHETPYYDDSYAVNNANLGPWGDAINDELLPYIEKKFKTIPHPYARIQQGGSTGGWESAASVVYRPDLFGVCFSSYPDSLDFHKHQDINLYDNTNAYVNPDGSVINSIREFDENGTEVILASVAQENHWELTHGTSSRSFLQWDVWQTVFGVQGLNGYPLETWDKVTGDIYPGAVEYWKHMDLAEYVTSNWDNELNLGEVLKNRMYIYVGLQDDYFLNEGVMAFQARVEAKGGAGWANFTYIADAGHGGVYALMDRWDYLEMLVQWVADHAPDGKTPLSPAVTTASSRGNKFENVMAYGGRDAALDRQEPPMIKDGVATPGKWDPGMTLSAQWFVYGKPSGEPFDVKEGEDIMYSGEKAHKVHLEVTGTKRGYEPETRKSKVVSCKTKKA